MKSHIFPIPHWDRGGRDRLVVGFTANAYHHWYFEFESWSERGVQHCVIKFVSDLRQVGGILRVLRFHPPIKYLVGYKGGVIPYIYSRRRKRKCIASLLMGINDTTFWLKHGRSKRLWIKFNFFSSY
jgi:hypothetical protein